MAIRVVLADDHNMVRTGIRNILQTAPGIEVVGEAANGLQALEMVADLAPDVLVLDVEMPVLRGIDVAQQLQAKGHPPSILAVSAHEDKHFIMGMLETGVSGYLTKSEVPDSLVQAVRGLARGEQGWVSRRVAARIAISLHSEKSSRFAIKLNDVKLLRLFLSGRSDSQIAKSLAIPPDEVQSRIDAWARAIRLFLRDRV